MDNEILAIFNPTNLPITPNDLPSNGRSVVVLNEIIYLDEDYISILSEY